MRMTEAVLKILDLRTCFYKEDKLVYAVDGVNLDIMPNQTHCIVGESGSGKSVTALSIMGLVNKKVGRIDSGSIIFEGADVTKMSETELQKIRGKKIAMIFQEPMTSLNPVLKIGDQITEGYIYHNKANRSEAEAKAKEMLKFVGLSNLDKLMKSYPHHLSGGMRQRIMIALAMMCNPSILIADEPTTALDVTIQAQILQLMKEMQKKFGMAIIFITHDLGVVREIADSVSVFYAGQIVETAPADNLFSSPFHPYTQALLDSIPSIDDNNKPLYAIPGSVPDPSEYIEGCRFSNRCKYALHECSQIKPELIEIRKAHYCRCSRKLKEYKK